MFYLALGYFVSYVPHAILAKALPSGIVPGVDTPIGGQAAWARLAERVS